MIPMERLTGQNRRGRVVGEEKRRPHAAIVRLANTVYLIG